MTLSTFCRLQFPNICYKLRVNDKSQSMLLTQSSMVCFTLRKGYLLKIAYCNYYKEY